MPAIVGTLLGEALALTLKLFAQNTGFFLHLHQLPAKPAEGRRRRHRVRQKLIRITPLIRLGLELEAQRHHQSRVSHQLAPERLSAAMLQYTHRKQRTQHRFDRPVLSAAEIALCLDRLHRFGKIQLLEDTFEPLQFAMQQFSFWIFSVIFFTFYRYSGAIWVQSEMVTDSTAIESVGRGSRMRHEVQQLIPVVVEEAFPEHFQSLEIANTRAFALAGLLPQFAG